jgi:uncharacterized protein DUF5752
MRQATKPFRFVTASYLIRIRAERAWTLGEMAAHLRTVPPESIFHHTFQSLEAHHYAWFSSDFAHWVTSACNQSLLGEELGAIDLRDFASIEELRTALVNAIERFLEASPHTADRPGFEPFFFHEALEYAMPIDMQATTLEELAQGIRDLSVQSLHYHFINSRIRLHLKTNDFSYWIADSLQLPALANDLNRVDFYANTLEGVRAELLAKIKRWK